MNELLEAAKDRDSAVFGIADLKKFFMWTMGVSAAALLGVGQYFHGKLSSNQDADAKRDVAIQQLQDQFKHSSETGQRLERAIEQQQTVSTQMLLQMTQLSGKVSSTEEISRNTQARVEALNDYLRNSHAPKKEVLSAEDSVYSPRGIQR